MTNDVPSFITMRNEILRRKVYELDFRRPDPRILDCGANLGLISIYYRWRYPAARITAFEADPTILPLLRKNLETNSCGDVEIVEAALAASSGSVSFQSGRACDGCVTQYRPEDQMKYGTTMTVPAVPLSDFLDEPVDLLKMNIEGAEWEVLSAAEKKLRQVRAMLIEYHRWPGLPNTLHAILSLLDRNGFDYLINDYDGATNPGVLPPFQLHENSRYFLLIYAVRRKMEHPES